VEHADQGSAAWEKLSRCWYAASRCRLAKRTHLLTLPGALFADENNNYNYDYKIRVGVKNSLVLQAGPEDQSNPQKKGGVAGITLCGTAGTAALDPSVYWSELSDINPIGVG